MAGPNRQRKSGPWRKIICRLTCNTIRSTGTCTRTGTGIPACTDNKESTKLPVSVLLLLREHITNSFAMASTIHAASLADRCRDLRHQSTHSSTRLEVWNKVPGIDGYAPLHEKQDGDEGISPVRKAAAARSARTTTASQIMRPTWSDEDGMPAMIPEEDWVRYVHTSGLLFPLGPLKFGGICSCSSSLCILASACPSALAWTMTLKAGGSTSRQASRSASSRTSCLYSTLPTLKVTG